MITSMQNKTVKELLKLKQKKYRKDYYLVETNHLVEEAIKAKQTDLIISTEPVDLGVENLVVSKEIMEKLASTKTPQPIMARCFIQKDKKLVDGKRYLILDYLQDPGNIGTLIRTALAFGIDQVILSNECVDLYNDKLLRSMQGAHFHLSCLYGDLKKIIPALKEKGVCVVGSALENGRPIHEIKKQEKMAYVLGNEGNGMEKEIIDICDQIAYIPIGQHGVITESNLKALHLLKEKGYKTFICTGRAPFYAKRLFGDLVSGIISCNGRYILYEGKKLYSRAFTKKQLDYYVHKLDQGKLGAMFVSDDKALKYHLDQKQEVDLEKEYGIEHLVDSLEGDFYTFDMFYQSQEHYQTMVEIFKEDLIINDHGGMGSCDCSTIEFDKGSAIAYLLDYFHIDKDNAYAFGDGYNDQAMFREVGHGIAMGNAVDVLKEKATYITDNFDQEGILKALYHEKVLNEKDNY